MGLPQWAQGRHQYPAHSPVVSQAPTEPHPAAWVYAARSQTHSVGPTPQDGPRLCREVDSALFGSTFFVIAGNSTSHVELAWVGRDLRARRGVAAVVTAAGRVPTGSQVAPERAIERSTPNAVTLVAPLDRHRARIARRCWGSGTLNREGRGIAGAESGRYSLPGCGGSGPPGESLVVTGRLLLQPSRVGMSIPLPIVTPLASQAHQRVTFTPRAFC